MTVVDTNVMARLVVGGEDGAEAAQLFEQDNEWAALILLIERTPATYCSDSYAGVR